MRCFVPQDGEISLTVDQEDQKYEMLTELILSSEDDKPIQFHIL